MLLSLLAGLHVVLSVGLVVLVLMHSGREGGLGGLGFTPSSHGGTHIVERNLTRLTIAVATIWFFNNVALFRLLA
jgi:preprotein translocase subunit SecG